METDIDSLVKYPMESDDWMVTVLIGGAAAFFSFLILPIFAVSGYMVRAIRAGMEGAEEPPVFDDWGELLKEGFIASVIGFIYQIVPIMVFVVFVIGSLIAMITGSEVGFGLGFIGLFAAFFVSWALSILFGYIGLAGIANYAREGNFTAAFDVGVIVSAITSREYIVSWLYVIGLNLVVGAIAGVIPVIGALVSLFLGFYALIIAGWLIGDGFAVATGEPVKTTPEVEATTA